MNLRMFLNVSHFYCPSTKLWKDNVFTRVCLSVCSRRGGRHIEPPPVQDPAQPHILNGQYKDG